MTVKPSSWDAEGSPWQQLLLRHMSVHVASESAYARVLDGLRDIERLFFSDRDETLGLYYDECHWLVQSSWSQSEPAPIVPQSTGRRVRHLVSLQARFMEEVFYLLRLDRYANAPDNRGWMNLFRSWGGCKTFQQHFHRIRMGFSKEFVEFHEKELEKRAPVDSDPVPHPWDDPSKLADRYVVFLDSGILGRSGIDEPVPGEAPSKETEQGGDQSPAQ